MPANDPDHRPEDDLDPGANTQMFQAFVDREESEEAGSPKSRAVLVTTILVGLLIVAVLAWLVLG